MQHREPAAAIPGCHLAAYERFLRVEAERDALAPTLVVDEDADTRARLPEIFRAVTADVMVPA